MLDLFVFGSVTDVVILFQGSDFIHKSDEVYACCGFNLVRNADVSTPARSSLSKASKMRALTRSSLAVLISS
jgi:hypothetical protein